MGTERNRIYLQHPDKADALLPAQLLKEDDGLLSVRLLEELTLLPNTETKQYFHDKHDLFYGFSCQVLRMESGGPNPVVSVKQTGPRERHENRETFRIPVYDDCLTATINEQHAGEVYDVGYNGLSFVSDFGGFLTESTVTIELVFDCDAVTGRMQVVYRNPLKDGRYRYGLSLDPQDKPFAKELEQITLNLQSIKARRASRIGINNKYAGNTLNFDEPSEEASAQRADVRLDSSNKRERRMHERKAWAGPAKVYSLEGNQLRVLEVNTLDLSQGGLCFLSRSYIYPDTEILFEKPVPGGLFRVCAGVRNVDMHGEGLHRVGVQFAGAPLKPGETHPKFYMV